MLISLQTLRALAAWLVVMHHVMQIFFDFEGESAWGRLFVQKGAVGVDLFFVISGLVIYLSTHEKAKPAGRFLISRIARIVPAYWFYSVITALVLVQLPGLLQGQAFEMNHFIQSLLFLPGENPAGFGLYPTLAVGWTLNHEMLFYLLFALVLLLKTQQRLLWVAVALFVVSEILAPAGVVSAFYRNDIVYEFLLGIMVGMAYKSGWIRQGVLLPLLVIGGALIALYQLDSSNRLLHWGLPSALIVGACLALEPYFNGNRVLKALGDCSYAVYLLHGLVLSIGWYLCRIYGFNVYAVIALCLPVILLGAWASYELLERRLYKVIQRRLEAPPSPAPRLTLSRQNY